MDAGDDLKDLDTSLGTRIRIERGGRHEFTPLCRCGRQPDLDDRRRANAD